VTTPETLKQLQMRIREATGADRELDHAILETLLPRERNDLFFYGTRFTDHPMGVGFCIALFERMLPGRRWTRTASGRFRVWGDDDLHDAEPRANDALTFLDVICAALIAEEEAKEKADVD